MPTSIQSLLRRRWLSRALPVAVFAALSSVTSAQDISALRNEIAALRAEQARIAELQARNEQSLSALEARLAATMPTATPAGPGNAPAGSPLAAQAVPVTPAPPRTGTTSGSGDSRWSITGDLRLRGQRDQTDDGVTPSRNSAQLRGRLGATYKVTDRLSLGARVVTGDPDDPNSTDVQLSNWDDDLQVALDLAYLQFKLQDFTLYAGKIPQPFTRTDLVWDGDVNPQGIGATFRRARADGSAIRANAALLMIDEQAGGSDSTMAGLQLGYDSTPINGLKFDASLGYYHYDLGSTAGADAGDFRSNLRNPQGSYVSDFHLFDVIAGIGWQPGSAKWPFRLVADYDKNFGAISGRDTAFGVDLIAGRASQPGDWRFTYGYAKTEVDSVLAAFSQDNIGIGTNYVLHALTIDYTPLARTQVSGIWYHYRPNDPLYAAANASSSWLDRFRVYFQVSF